MVVRGGTHVTFGAMSSKLLASHSLPNIQRHRIERLWLTRWLEETGPDSEDLTMDEIFSMISEGTLKTYIEADYSLEEWKTALEHNAKPKNGKNNL